MKSSWSILFLSVVGILGAFGASIGPQVRSQFPSPHSTPLIGFTFANDDIVVDEGGKDIRWNPTNGLLEFPSGTGNTVGVFEVAGEVDNFCEIPSPKLVEDLLSEFNFPSSLAVQPRRAYILLLSGTGGPKSFLVMWVTEESYLPASLVIEHQSWIDSENIANQSAPCEPAVKRIFPPVIYSQGSIVHIYGENFGTDIDEISVDIGGYQCAQQALVVSQSVIKCVLNPQGNAPGGVHPVSVTIHGRKNQPSVGAYFSGGCTLICLDDTYPDSKCEQCVSFDSICSGSGGNGGSGDSQSVTVEKLSEYFISDLVRGQKASDDNFLVVADTYKNTLLEKFPMPRYSIPEADVQISVSVQSAVPRLQVVPVTQLLENFPTESLSKFEFKLIADEARWTRTQNGTEVAYRLEF